jgi:hypothetical protein
MRSLELALLLVNFAVLIRRRSECENRGWGPSLPFAALLVLIIQVALEGYRWQMYPAYVVTLGVAVSALSRRMVTFGNWTRLAGVGCVLASGVLCVVLPVFELPRPTGPFPIGSVIRHLVDKSREEPRDDRPGARRELMVQIWYPAERRGPAQFYCSRAEMPLKKEQLSLVRPHASEGVPIARSPGRYPVLIFSPSWQGHRYQNTFQAQELASHGFVVVTTDHPYGTELVVLPDGRRIKTRLGAWIDFSSFASMEASIHVDEAELRVRTADVRFVLNSLEGLNRDDPAGLLTGHLDFSRVGIFGHSFGGAVAAEACCLDHRFRAGIDLDGCLFGEVAKYGIEQPFLFITGDGPPPKPIPLTSSLDPRNLAEAYYYQDGRNVRDGLEKHGGYVLRIRGASHMNYCDSPLFSPIRRLTGAGPIDASRAMSIVNRYTLAFFNRYLNGQSEPLLGSPALRFPETRLEVWQPPARGRTQHSNGPDRPLRRSERKT